MSFWGCAVKPGAKVAAPVPETHILHVSQACLHEPKEGKNYLRVQVQGKTFTVACLEKDKVEHVGLDLFFSSGDHSFTVVGKNEVHLVGYFEPNEGEEEVDEPAPLAQSARASPKTEPKAKASPKVAAKAADAKAALQKSVLEGMEEDDLEDEEDEELDFDEDEEEEEEEPPKAKASPKASPKVSPKALAKSNPQDTDDASDDLGSMLEEGDEEELLEGDESEEEEEEPAPKAVAAKSPKRSAADGPAGSPAKKPKAGSPATAPAASPGTSDALQASYIKQLHDYLKQHGKMDLGALGSKVQRPKELPKNMKLKAILEQNSEKFLVAGNSISAK